MENNIINDHSEKFLERYLNAFSPTGYEVEGQKIWIDYIKNYVDEVRSDSYGTAYGIINPEAKFKVVIEAHADEISWYVNYISKEGLIYVIRNGGSDHMIAPSKDVVIHTKKGLIPGVFGWPAIHVRNKATEQKPDVHKIWVDVGASSDEEIKEMGIHVGCMITFPDPFRKMNDKYYVCRALDNRMGGFMIAEVARLLHENGDKLDFGLYVTNSVQEEIGLRGAEMITQTIKPDLAIVTDVTHDTSTPMMDKKKQGDISCGKGPVVSYAPAVQNNFRDFVLDVAEKNEIPFQRIAASRYTGTDTDAFAYSNGGVPSTLISLALRYMHTTVEMVNIEDSENVIRLIYQSVKALKAGQDFKYF